MHIKSVAVATTTDTRRDEAQQLANRLNLPFIDQLDATIDFTLLLTPTFLGLVDTHASSAAPFYIDFLTGKLRYRSHQASRKKELLARALGVKAQDQAYIVDATAGLGRDGFVLASLGFEVTLIERSPILYALLNDGIQRARHDSKMAIIIDRMHLIHADAVEWLAKHSAPDIIYLDPMFPHRSKSALVKKEMVLLQNLLSLENDADALLKLALTCATKRVVVKRPRLAANLADCTPSFSLNGTSSRFDIYLTPAKRV